MLMQSCNNCARYQGNGCFKTKLKIQSPETQWIDLRSPGNGRWFLSAFRDLDKMQFKRTKL